MPDQVLYPAAIEEIDNLTGTVGQLSDENDFITADDGNSSTEIRVSFPTPDGDLDDAQTVNIRVRRTDNSNREPDLTVELYEDGTSVDTLLEEEEVNSPDGEWFNLTFDAGQIGDPSQVEIYCSGARTGGPQNDRNTVEFDVIEWEASLAEEQEEEHNFSAGDTALAISAGGQLTPSVTVAADGVTLATQSGGKLSPVVPLGEGQRSLTVSSWGSTQGIVWLSAGDDALEIGGQGQADFAEDEEDVFSANGVVGIDGDSKLTPRKDVHQDGSLAVGGDGAYTPAALLSADGTVGISGQALLSEETDVALFAGDSATGLASGGALLPVVTVVGGSQLVTHAGGKLAPITAVSRGDIALEINGQGQGQADFATDHVADLFVLVWSTEYPSLDFSTEFSFGFVSEHHSFSFGFVSEHLSLDFATDHASLHYTSEHPSLGFDTEETSLDFTTTVKG